MSTNSGIEWTNATWNPVVGCTRASAGCDSCYAVLQSHRNAMMALKRGDMKTHAKYTGLTVLNKAGDRHFNGVVRTLEEDLDIPLKWKKPRRIFVNSMSDLFHKDVPFEFVDKVFAVMWYTQQHTFQVLTKRPDRMAEYTQSREKNVLDAVYDLCDKTGDLNCSTLPEAFHKWPLPNVWLGTSVENQDAAENRIPHLLRCPAVVRFLSVEPLIGPVNLDLACGWRIAVGCLSDDPPNFGSIGIHWVIVGGESGPGARPCDVDWIRAIVAQCKAASVKCFVKQFGDHVVQTSPYTTEWPDGTNVSLPVADIRLRNRKGGDPLEWPEDLRVREWPEASRDLRVREFPRESEMISCSPPISPQA